MLFLAHVRLVSGRTDTKTGKTLSALSLEANWNVEADFEANPRCMKPVLSVLRNLVANFLEQLHDGFRPIRSLGGLNP